MSTPRLIEMVFAAEAFTQPPEPGTFIASKSGLSAMAIAKVRRVIGDRSGARYRLIGMRVKLCDMPADAVLRPWPKRVKLTQPQAGPAAAPPPRPRTSPATEKIEARRRVVTLLRDDRDSNRAVHKVRVDNKTVLNGEWRDPDDLSPNRRTARIVSGYRARDSVQNLLDNSTISKSHANAARRFRKEYELGEIGLRPSRNLAEAPSGFSSGVGPSESRLRHLETYQATARALLPHLLDVITAIVIHDETILSYATARKMNRQSVAGYVLASLDYLKDYYKNLDDERRKMDEAIAATA